MKALKQHLTAVNLICAALFLGYVYFFWADLSRFWFNPKWTTDDALQQSFPLHAVHHPHIFEDDLLYNAMRGYLPPLHRAISQGITRFTADPVMTGHWLMLVQIVLSALFLFLAVLRSASIAAALFAATWLLHTRHVMQRLTGGLPRGWALPLLAAFVWLVMQARHKSLLALLLIGCLLHPPAALCCAAAYGLYLLWGVCRPSTRSLYRKPLLALIVLAPVYLVAVFLATHRPAYMGSVVSYEEAARMPEFNNPGGRFPFVPLPHPWWELKVFGFEPFFQPIYRPGYYWGGGFVKIASWKRSLAVLLPLALAVGLYLSYRTRRRLVPAQIGAFLIAVLATYAAARIFAFKLFVPDRYLQYPMTIFWIFLFTTALWRLCHRSETGGAPEYGRTDLQSAWRSALALASLALVIVIGSGDGLYGSSNFNYPSDKYGRFLRWIKNNTPERAYFAGHPTHLDGVPLFGMRRALATTETTHPFFPVYLREMERRLTVSLKAHYAADLREVLHLLEAEGVDYFVFSREKFRPKQLALEKYFMPLDALVKELTARPPGGYAYHQLPAKVDLVKHPYMPFKDGKSAIVDLKKLRAHLDQAGGR